MKKYEARIYVGKDLYEDIEKLVNFGMFSSVNQALAEIVKSNDFREFLKATTKTIEQAIERNNQ